MYMLESVEDIVEKERGLLQLFTVLSVTRGVLVTPEVRSLKWTSI